MRIPMKIKLFLLFSTLLFTIADMSAAGRSGRGGGGMRGGGARGGMRGGAKPSFGGRGGMQRPATRPGGGQQRPGQRPGIGRPGQGGQWAGRPGGRPTTLPGRPGAGFQRPGGGRPGIGRPGQGGQWAGRPGGRPGTLPGRPGIGGRPGLGGRPTTLPARNGRLQQLQGKLNPNKPLRSDRNRNPQRLNQQRNFMNRRFDRYHSWNSLYRSNFPLFISLFPAAFQGAYGYYPPIAYDYQDLTGELPQPDPNFDAYASGAMPIDFGPPPMQGYPGQGPYQGSPPQAGPYYPQQDTSAWVDYGNYPQPGAEFGPYDQQGYGEPPIQDSEQYGQGSYQEPLPGEASVGYAFGKDQPAQEPGRGYIRIIRPEKRARGKKQTELLAQEDLS